MIRRISHIILAGVLLVLTTGLTIHHHYCGGNLIETAVLHVPEFCCGEGSDCCENTSETYLLDQDYVEIIQLMVFSEIAMDIPVIDVFDKPFLPIVESEIVHPHHLRPPDLSTALARLQVFTL